MDMTYAATCIMLLIFIASVFSVELALSAAIIEIAAGVIAGNFLGLRSAPWMDFLAGFGGILLTFLAGAEVDSRILRSKLKESLLIGGLSFVIPYVAAIAYCYWGAGWTWNASLIAGCALSTTSLAVVYAVLVETGLANTEIGKIIMAATFVTDFGVVAALSLSFAEYNIYTLWFILGSIAIIAAAARWLPGIFLRYGKRIIEPEIKLLFFLLFSFMSLAQLGKGHAVLPVFILGLYLGKMFREHRDLQKKLRVVAFAMITPFFFIKGGMSVSLQSIAAQWPLFLALFGIKFAAKFIGVWPVAKRYVAEHAEYTTLLMSTGLTFGTISSLYGLQAGYIDKGQFSVLVAVVIATAVVPTFIAQRWFSPKLSKAEMDELSAREEESA